MVRRPNARTATVHGGGWIASGTAGKDRLPQVAWPLKLDYAPREGAGEVQTPLIGDAARTLTVGDRVWLRRTKSGEPMEHATEIAVVSLGARGYELMPTYRGEGKCFL